MRILCNIGVGIADRDHSRSDQHLQIRVFRKSLIVGALMIAAKFGMSFLMKNRSIWRSQIISETD